MGKRRMGSVGDVGMHSRIDYAGNSTCILRSDSRMHTTTAGPKVESKIWL